MSDKDLYDVIIIGAGVAGCASAIALKQIDQNLNVCLIERSGEESHHQAIGETLPPQVSQLLHQLELWDQFKSCNFLPSYGSSAAWGSEQLHQNEYLFSPYGYGWHLDRNLFNRLVREAALARGVTIRYGSSLTSCEKGNACWALEVYSARSGSATVQAKFVIDASGRKADFASRRGVDKLKEDKLVGIYHFFTRGKASDLGQGSCVETVPRGWWYSAGLPNDQWVVGFMTDSDIAREESLNDHSAFLKQIQATRFTQNRIDLLSAQGAPRLVAANTQRLQQVVGSQWLAVGDAASTYDPISSSGIFKALAMSRFAAFAAMDSLRGIPGGQKKYADIIAQDYQSYLQKKRQYYAEETRFSDQPFWQRRVTEQLTAVAR